MKALKDDVDVSQTERWNDSYGHASGDSLSRELAVLLRSSATDPDDIVARNGALSFALCLLTSKNRVLSNALERLRASIADANFSGLHAHGAGAEEVKISASIGVACFPIDAQSPSVLLEKADEAIIIATRWVATAFRFSALTEDSCGPIPAQQAARFSNGDSLPRP